MTMARVGQVLDHVEIRILGVLLEKEQTTPDIYPMSVNAILVGCNQKTAREPVMELLDGAIHGGLRSLAQGQFVQRIEGVRVTKWRHTLDSRWNLDSARKAIMSLLMLRGEQTAGELRTRSDRTHEFASVGEVEQTLGELAEGPEPLVRLLPRQPGQKEARWIHCLGIVEESRESAAVQRYASDEPEDLATRVADLNRRVRELERIVGLLAAEKGVGSEHHE